jgi:hypothetical protein
MTYAEIKTGTKSVIKVTKDVVNGNTFGQIRLWTTDKTTGDLVPTKKGVAFRLGTIPQIAKALAELQADAGEGGGEA